MGDSQDTSFDFVAFRFFGCIRHNRWSERSASDGRADIPVVTGKAGNPRGRTSAISAQSPSPHGAATRMTLYRLAMPPGRNSISHAIRAVLAKWESSRSAGPVDRLRNRNGQKKSKTGISESPGNNSWFDGEFFYVAPCREVRQEARDAFRIIRIGLAELNDMKTSSFRTASYNITIVTAARVSETRILPHWAPAPSAPNSEKSKGDVGS